MSKPHKTCWPCLLPKQPKQSNTLVLLLKGNTFCYKKPRFGAFLLIAQKWHLLYNTCMNLKINELLQWTGAVFIIAGHSLNAMGPSVYPYNILAFFVGTILFMAWTIRVANKPQLMVNIVALAIGASGLAKAFG